jgi:hypothetical protein
MKNIFKYKKTIIGAVGILLIVCIPAATWLQARAYTAKADKTYDAAYLVCGARAQNERIKILIDWINDQAAANRTPPVILIGSDPQKSLWCRRHQTNHTVTAWAVEKLDTITKQDNPPPALITIPGNFSTTDGEMIVLADYLRNNPQIKSIALATSPYHARRSLQRLQEHSDENLIISIIPAAPKLRNRNPIIVMIEYLKIVRDKSGLSHAPLISRKKK